MTEPKLRDDVAVLPGPTLFTLVKVSLVEVAVLPLPMTVTLFMKPPVVLARLAAPNTDATEKPLADALLPGPTANATDVKSVEQSGELENVKAEAHEAFAVAICPTRGAAPASNPVATAATATRLANGLALEAVLAMTLRVPV